MNPPAPAIRVIGHRREGDALLLDGDCGRLKLQVCGDDVIRVVYTREKEFSDRQSLVVVDRALGPASWTVRETRDAIELRTSRLRLCVSRATGAFTWRDARGGLLTREPERGGKTLSRVDVLKVRHEQSAMATEQGVDGGRALVRNPAQYVDRQAWQARLDFVWAGGEALYGLGQHEEGVLNYRGREQYLYQQNMKVAVPMLLSSRGYGVLLDACSLITFHDDQFGSYLWAETVDELDYYFLYGPTFDGVVDRYRRLTGAAPMLPVWSFGYVQSKERYKTQAELIEVAAEYRRRGIPLDVIVLDWMSWPGELWGQKSFDPERFPDPAGLTRALHAMNVRMMISIWPHMDKGGDNHAEMETQGCLLPNRRTCDVFQEKARALYWKQANDGLFSKGVDAWWCDCTEPFEADWGGDYKPEPAFRMQRNTEAAKAFIDPQFINAFSLLHSRGIYEGQRAATSARRVLNLTRSAYAGQQRYATVVWSGDTPARWDILRREIAGGLNFCASGIPYWTLDIGAFFVKSEERWFWRGDFPGGCEDEGYRELYARWFQIGAFLPMFRSHGTDTPREVWRFGEPGSATYDTLVKFDFLRYRLLPYIYSLAGMVTHRHYTMLRMLAFDFCGDPDALGVADQFMFGPAFLVCPVTAPMYYGPGSVPLAGVPKTRPVYLPRGADWWDFWTGRRERGGRTVAARATLDRMPLYVRAGSIVPMAPRIQHSGELAGVPLELRIYPGADGAFSLYEDAGDGYGYEQGEFATVEFRWNDRKRRLSIGARKGAFPGLVPRREFRVVLVRGKRGSGPGETSSPDAVIAFGGESMRIDLAGPSSAAGPAKRKPRRSSAGKGAP